MENSDSQISILLLKIDRRGLAPDLFPSPLETSGAVHSQQSALPASAGHTAWVVEYTHPVDSSVADIPEAE